MNWNTYSMTSLLCTQCLTKISHFRVLTESRHFPQSFKREPCLPDALARSAWISSSCLRKRLLPVVTRNRSGAIGSLGRGLPWKFCMRGYRNREPGTRNRARDRLDWSQVLFCVWMYVQVRTGTRKYIIDRDECVRLTLRNPLGVACTTYSISLEDIIWGETAVFPTT